MILIALPVTMIANSNTEMFCSVCSIPLQNTVQNSLDRH